MSGTRGLLGLTNFAVEKWLCLGNNSEIVPENSVALGLHHSLQIKANRLQDFHAVKLHYISPGAESAHNKEIDLASPL